MPQLDLFTFSSQLFWLIFAFWGLYAGSFLNFILPFAFIIKIREYLSINTTTVITNNLFSPKTIELLNNSYTTLNVVTKTVGTRFSEDMQVLSTVATNSVNSLRDDSNLEAVKTYISLASVTDLLLTNRVVNTVSRLAMLSKGTKNGLKNGLKKTVGVEVPKTTASAAKPNLPKKK